MLMAMLLLMQEVPVTEAAACARVTRAAEEERPNLPMMVDPVTRLESIEADCAAKTYVMNKTVLGDLKAIRAGWQDRKQAELNEVVCGSSLLAIERLGWKFSEKLRFPGGEEFIFVVSCD